MNNIFKAFNVTSQREFDRLIETLKLDGNDTATLFTVLNEDCDYNYLREKVLETAITFGNGSYEKLQKQFEKTPFKRQLKEMPMSDEQYKKLKIGSRVKFDKPSHVPQPEKYDTVIDKSDNEIKTQFHHHGGQARTVCKWNPEHFKQVYSTIDEDTVYDHSWYENEDGKYPKRTKDGVIIEDDKDIKLNKLKEGLDTDLDLGKILGSMKSVISTTTSMELLNKLFNSLNEKIANAKSDEDIAKINEIKSLIKERVNEINNIGKEEDDTIKECFEYSIPVSPVFNDIKVNSTLEDVFNNIKPATINIEINYEEKTDEDEEEMAKNHMRALASHIGNDVDCCEENRIEELETVNTLLSMLSDYFNKKLGV